jgi:uncharacterized protein
MTVTIFGATGMVGKQLIIHALAKGWKVRAFGRQIDEMLVKEDLNKDNFSAVKGYVFDAGDVNKALKGCDAVLSALGGDIDGSDHTRSLGIKNIVTQMEKNGIKRIVALGGLGVLDNPEGNKPLFEEEDYPKQFVPVAKEHYAAYQHLKNSSLDWTFICAPNIMDEDADGKFETVPEGRAEGWEIKAGNLALCMVQAIASGSFEKQRVGIANSQTGF